MCPSFILIYSLVFKILLKNRAKTNKVSPSTVMGGAKQYLENQALLWGWGEGNAKMCNSFHAKFILGL